MLEEVFGDVRAPRDEADGFFFVGGRGSSEAGDHGEGFVWLIEVEEEGLDVRVGKPRFEHLERAHWPGGDGEGVGRAFDFAGPEEVGGEVEDGWRHVEA